MTNRIKELRARHNLTQEELARRAGVRRETIVFLEKGKYNPSLQLAHDIAMALFSKIDEVFIFDQENIIEAFDILNEKGDYTGEKRNRQEAHKYGLWHRTVHVWLINTKKELLVQKRSEKLLAHPGLWDISAAGHIKAGISSLDGAVKEFTEELGLPAGPDDFEKLFTLKNQTVFNNGTFVNNEFQDVYLVRKDIPADKIPFNKDETQAVKYVSIQELDEIKNKKNPEYVEHDEEYSKLIEYLNSNETSK